MLLSCSGLWISLSWFLNFAHLWTIARPTYTRLCIFGRCCNSLLLFAHQKQDASKQTKVTFSACVWLLMHKSICYCSGFWPLSSRLCHQIPAHLAGSPPLKGRDSGNWNSFDQAKVPIYHPPKRRVLSLNYLSETKEDVVGPVLAVSLEALLLEGTIGLAKGQTQIQKRTWSANTKAQLRESKRKWCKIGHWPHWVRLNTANLLNFNWHSLGGEHWTLRARLYGVGLVFGAMTSITIGNVQVGCVLTHRFGRSIPLFRRSEKTSWKDIVVWNAI